MQNRCCDVLICLEIPPGRPVLLRNLTGGRAETTERFDQHRSFHRRDLAHDSFDLSLAMFGHGAHHV